MYKRTIVSLLALLFAVPLYATSAQEQVNAEVLSYLRQGKIKALATYLGSLKECPRRDRFKMKDVPDFCVKQKFNKRGQPAADHFKHFDFREFMNNMYDRPIYIVKEVTMKGETYTTSSTLNAASIPRALYQGLNQIYKDEFKTEPNIFNKKNYVDFYDKYKNTWLKKDVMDLMTWGWILQSPYFYPEGTLSENWGKSLYQMAVLAKAVDMKLEDVLPIRDNYILREGYLFVIDGAWGEAVRIGGREARKIFYDLKRAFRDYYFSEEMIDAYSPNNTMTKGETPFIVIGIQADRIVRMRDWWKYIMITPVPEDMKIRIRKVIARCYDIANDPEKMEKKSWSDETKQFEIRYCNELKKLAKKAGVYRNSAAKAKAKTKAAVKAKKKAGTKMKTPIPLSQHHPR